MKAYVIIEVNSGILEDPELFSTEKKAQKRFIEIVKEAGFREPRKGESFDKWFDEFKEWEESPKLRGYDPADYEVHLYNPILVK